MVRDVLLRVDLTAAVPLGEQLANQLRVGIITGAIAAGERLPTARDLGTSLGVNRNTVLKVYQTLRDEGLVEMRPGRGVSVTARMAAGTADLVVAVRAATTAAIDAGVSADALCALIREEYQ